MCTFCQIVADELPSFEVYKNNEVTAFLDRYPIVAGHTVVVPNMHVERLDHLQNDSVARALMQAIIEVPRILIEEGLCTDYTILSDNGIYADQDIPHVHIHIIPRHEKEELQLRLPTNSYAAEEDQLRYVWSLIQGKQAP